MCVFEKYILRLESGVNCLREFLDVRNDSVGRHVFEIFHELAFLLLHAHHFRYCEQGSLRNEIKEDYPRK